MRKSYFISNFFQTNRLIVVIYFKVLTGHTVIDNFFFHKELLTNSLKRSHLIQFSCSSCSRKCLVMIYYVFQCPSTSLLVLIW